MSQTDFRVIVMGCGSSTGSPNPACLLNPGRECKQCPAALTLPPKQNPNYRGNPSLVIAAPVGEGQEDVVQIDVCKTLRENVIRWFPEHNLRTINSVILSHGHADAMFGLDDLRGIQLFDRKTMHRVAVPVYLQQEAFDTCKQVFSYLVPPELLQPPIVTDEAEESKEAVKKVIRPVTAIDWNIIEPFKPFTPSYEKTRTHDPDGNLLPALEFTSKRTIFPLEITPLPVMHGEDMVAFGYAFGSPETGNQVVYISDVSRILPETWAWLEALESVQLFVVDSLFQTHHNSTHFVFEETMTAIRRLKPEVSFFTGMDCEYDFHTLNEKLAKVEAEEGLRIFVPCDGLQMAFPGSKISHPIHTLPLRMVQRPSVPPSSSEVSLQALLDAQGCATVDALLAQSTVTDQKTVQTTTGAVIGLFNVLQDRPDGDKQLVTLLAALGVLDFDPATVDADLIFGSCQLEAAEEKRYLETRSAASACTASCTDGNRCWCALTSFLASPFKLSLDEETAVSLAQYEGLNVLHICVLMGAFDALQYMFENDLCRYDMKDYVSEKCISPLYLAACVMDTPPYRLITLLCQHGANALMELPTQTMDNVAVKVAASLSSVGKTEEEYNKLLTMATLNIQWLTMVAHAEDVPLNLK